MTNLRLPYLMRQRDRQGRWVWYFRRGKGKRTRLRGAPGSAEFIAAYHAALGDSKSPRRSVPRTWRWLCEQYLASPEFGEFASATRHQRRNVLHTTWDEPVRPDVTHCMGDVPLEHFGPRAVRVLRDRKKDHPEAANHRVKAVAAVYKWAIEAVEGVETNPARDVPNLRKRNPDGHHTWTVAEVERYRRRHAIGTKARLAMEILLYTGGRRSDAVRFGRPMVVEGALVWTEAKGRDRAPKQREVPILPQLADVLAATTLTGHETWLVTQYGRPFTVAGFGNWFRDRCDEAGLKHCTAHGLRKAGATIAAENGATLHQLMAIFGWQSAKQALVYTRRADAKRLAREAMGLLVGRDR